MRRLLFIILSFNICSAYSLGKDPKYPVSDIPEQLLKDVHLVTRLHRGEFIIEKADRAIFKLHKVVTILNENGDGHALVGSGYDKLRKLEFHMANVYDKEGKQIYSLKKKDIIDESNISGFSLYEDSRVRGIDLRQTTYPYTIEYEYEVQYNFLYSIPDWYPIHGERISVQRSEYIVKAPEGLRPRFREINVGEEVKQETKAEGFVTYRWTFENLKPIEIEPFSKGLVDVAPVIYASPSRFSFEGYSGDMSTWQGMAAWLRKLNEGRDLLPPEAIAAVKDLVKNISSREEKIERLYQYMQKRTRYVSIQLGIGGMQPFPASVVEETGYGDCKALSNYMRSLLKVIGIESHYTLVEAGASPQPVLEDFPNHTFNHVILCVPNKGDTIWLECTSQTAPFGYMGKFTGDREVFVVTENGGKIARTPSYDHERNMISTRMTIELDKEGNGYATLIRDFRGLGYEYNDLDYVLTLTDKDRKDWVHENLNIADYSLGEFSFSENKQRIPTVQFRAKLGIRKLGSVSGKRLFIPLNFMNPARLLPKLTGKRNTPIYIRYSSLKSDTLTYKLPQNYTIEFIPEEVNVESPFGSYSLTVNRDGDVIHCQRRLKLNKGTYQPDKYDEMAAFFQSVREADLKKMVLLNKT